MAAIGGHKQIGFSIIVPVYRNSETIPMLVERLNKLSDEFDCGLECVFVVDGSPDDSADELRRVLPTARFFSQLLCLSRNFGSFAAIRAGLQVARGDLMGVMAADLQEPPELMLSFYKHLLSGDAEIIVGRREKRNDPRMSRVSADFYWRMYKRLIQPQMTEGGVDVFGCTRAVALALVSLKESHSSLVAQLFWLGYTRLEVPYVRQPREHGKSGWSFRKKVAYLLDSVFAFTSLPIYIILLIGVFGTGASVLTSIVVFVTWALGGIAIPGYSALMLVLLCSTGAILFALGIVGTYVWRTYENSKFRPLFIAQTSEHFEPAEVS